MIIHFSVYMYFLNVWKYIYAHNWENVEISWETETESDEDPYNSALSV